MDARIRENRGKLDRKKRNPRKNLCRDERVEAAMAGVVVPIIALVVGLVSGVILVVALAVRREDRRYSLINDAPDRLSRGARRLNGVGRRDLDTEPFRRMGELIH